MKTTETKFPRIDLKLIHPDPNQPRKFFDAEKLEELKQSILQVDIIQAVTVRPHPKKSGEYMLVVGERRLKACGLAGKKDIPALIKQMTDEEALNLQIQENLHRQDINPIEEAVAFLSYRKKQHWDDAELAARVGKSKHYVRQRIKLNDLIEPIQEALFKGVVKHSDCMRICQLPAESQKLLWKNVSRDYYFKVPTMWPLRIDSNVFSSFEGRLSNAGFPLDDATLDKEFGACSSCQFNTAFNELFPEAAADARCTNVSCFKTKRDVWMNRQLEIFKDDDRAILITTYTSYFVNDQFVKKVKAQTGCEVYYGRQYEGYKERPVEPVRKDFKTDADYNTALAKHTKKLEKFNFTFKALDEQNLVRALIVDGDNFGSWVLVKLLKVNAAASNLSVDTKTKITAAGIVDREKRKKELDGEKIHARVQDMMLNESDYLDSDDVTDIERSVFMYLTWLEIDSEYKDALAKEFGLKAGTHSYDTHKPNTLLAIMEVMQSKRNNDFQNKIVRAFILSNITCNQVTEENSAKALSLIKIAESYYYDDVLQIRKDIAAAAEKRITRTNDRLKALAAPPATKKIPVYSRNGKTITGTAEVPVKGKRPNFY